MSDDQIFSKPMVREAMRASRDAFVAALPDSVRAIAFSRPPGPLARLFIPGRTVAAYRAMGSEADPAALLAAAAAAGCTTALPHVTSRSAPMRFLAWSPDDPLEKGVFGLSQPRADSEAVQPDIVLVPLLAFDAAMNRMGQGAGFYDRALSLLPDAVTIGIAWSVQQLDRVPTDPWDVPLDAILTERSWIVPS
jgi:5-formyltetrahydrofolate cyclo-ligase